MQVVNESTYREESGFSSPTVCGPLDYNVTGWPSVASPGAGCGLQTLQGGGSWQRWQRLGPRLDFIARRAPRSGCVAFRYDPFSPKQHTFKCVFVGCTILPMPQFQLATFQFDVTPPTGHSLCGGLIKPVAEVRDGLQALGFVLLGAGSPIVVCVVDWTGLCNTAHRRWREQFATAAGTTPDRVSVHCVHQHDAPLVCLDAQRFIEAEGDMPHTVEVAFFEDCLIRGQHAIEAGLRDARLVNQIGCGQAKVEQVASNRRVARDEAGRVVAERRSFCRQEQLRNMPEGVIDPWLKTVSFCDQDQAVVACHYYATHPQSFYGEGQVSSDFVGLARKRRQQEDSECLHIYFTGCAGNISAGKYNNGSAEARVQLTDRIYDGIVRSEQDLERAPLQDVNWRTVEIVPTPRETLVDAVLVEQLGNRYYMASVRGRAAFMLAWKECLRDGHSLILSRLRANDVDLLHLPGECFIEYQLRAQACAPGRFVATAAYGDVGPWYIPVKEEYGKGGYELTSTFCDPGMDGLLTKAIQELLQ